jgi:plasmid stabilization system protein ParE
MRYRVALEPQAQADLREIHNGLKVHAAGAAVKWSAEIRALIKTLAVHPHRCALAPESPVRHREIRELLYGTPNRKMYRIFFAIEQKTVHVVHVRHASRLPWDGESS